MTSRLPSLMPVKISERLVWLSEKALLRRFPSTTPLGSALAVARCYERLRRLSLLEVEELIPAADSLAIVLRTSQPSEALLAALDATDGDGQDVGGGGPPSGECLEIPVRYGGAFGPDLDFVAATHGLDPVRVVEMHAAAEYVVGFLGFAPGFGYLVGLPPTLATPRRATPRASVEPGSVAIGGVYTGIYPSRSPGGWHMIGCADLERLKLWNASAATPALLRPGLRVRFQAV